MRKLLLCFFVAAIALCAADFTGKWSGTLTATDPNGEAHDGSAYLTLQQTGDTLTGSGWTPDPWTASTLAHNSDRTDNNDGSETSDDADDDGEPALAS